MAAQTYVGPQTQVFPHLRALDGEPGTLVLRPGESYDFGGGLEGYKEPPGPAWWWKPAAPERAAAPSVKTPPAPPAPAPAAAGAADKTEG